MCDVVRLKRGSAAFHFALDMVGSLDGADRPVLPERPMPGARGAHGADEGLGVQGLPPQLGPGFGCAVARKGRRGR